MNESWLKVIRRLDAQKNNRVTLSKDDANNILKMYSKMEQNGYLKVVRQDEYSITYELIKHRIQDEQPYSQEEIKEICKRVTEYPIKHHFRVDEVRRLLRTFLDLPEEIETPEQPSSDGS
jgi:hypothetical protein